MSQCLRESAMHQDQQQFLEMNVARQTDGVVFDDIVVVQTRCAAFILLHSWNSCWSIKRQQRRRYAICTEQTALTGPAYPSACRSSNAKVVDDLVSGSVIRSLSCSHISHCTNVQHHIIRPILAIQTQWLETATNSSKT